MHRQLVAVLDGPLDLVDVGEVDLRVDALGEQVQPQRDQVDVAGALAVAEQAALDPVGAGQQAQLGGGHAGAAVVVRVQATARRESRRGRWRCIHSIESAYTLGVAISTVAGRLTISGRSGVGSITSMTAEQTSSAYSSSVPV